MLIDFTEDFHGISRGTAMSEYVREIRFGVINEKPGLGVILFVHRDSE